MSRFLVTLGICVLFSCGSKHDAEYERSPVNTFYYWQTSLRDFSWHDSIYQSLDVRKVYYRFFDIEWNSEAGAPVPVSPLSMDFWDSRNMDVKAEIIPVVFITNETFKHLSVDQSRDLARYVHRRVMNQVSPMLVRRTSNDLFSGDDSDHRNSGPFRIKSEKFNEQHKYDSLSKAAFNLIRQIQFDCDWTSTTKEKYFTFLSAAKEHFSGMEVTSTLRLYQYKYPKDAGVPPVSRATLMCYNAGDITKKETRNSIFDAEEIMSYLNGAEVYKIPLDYALPVFSWAVMYRENKLQAILSSQVIMENYGSYFKAEGEGHYLVTEDFVYGYTSSAIYLRAGDEIRIEEPDFEKVEEIASWLSVNKNNPEAVLTLYHLNDHDLKTHSEEIESIFNSF